MSIWHDVYMNLKMGLVTYWWWQAEQSAGSLSAVARADAEAFATWLSGVIVGSVWFRWVFLALLVMAGYAYLNAKMDKVDAFWRRTSLGEKVAVGVTVAGGVYAKYIGLGPIESVGESTARLYGGRPP